MKRVVVAVVAAILATSCSSPVTKNFKVFADPYDSVIKVISGADLNERKYSSPATVTVEVPSDPALASKAFLEVQRENYRSKVIPLKDIKPGETLNIQLEKIIQKLVKYSLKYRLKTPAASNELQFRDRFVAIVFSIGEQAINVRIDNMTEHDVKILWDRSEYTDPSNQPHRIMPSTVHFQDRNNPISDQTIQGKSSIQEDVIPISNVFLSPQNKGYGIHPLFPLDTDMAAGLKGKSFALFIPIEVDRVIIPYNFKIEIIDAKKETVNN